MKTKHNMYWKCCEKLVAGFCC